MELENPFEGRYHAIPLDYHLARFALHFARRSIGVHCITFLHYLRPLRSFSEFIHDLVATQLPSIELSGALTLKKVEGMQRRLSVMPHARRVRHRADGEVHPAQGYEYVAKGTVLFRTPLSHGFVFA